MGGAKASKGEGPAARRELPSRRCRPRGASTSFSVLSLTAGDFPHRPRTNMLFKSLAIVAAVLLAGVSAQDDVRKRERREGERDDSEGARRERAFAAAIAQS